MKAALTALLFTMSFSAFAAPNLNQKITMNARNVTIDAAMKEITKKSGVEFIVSPDLGAQRKISIDVKEAILKDVLNFIADEQYAKWEVGTDNKISISAIK